MTSQQWLTEAEVNDPIWQHYMTVTIPDTVNSNISFCTSPEAANRTVCLKLRLRTISPGTQNSDRRKHAIYGAESTSSLC